MLLWKVALLSVLYPHHLVGAIDKFLSPHQSDCNNKNKCKI